MHVDLGQIIQYQLVSHCVRCLWGYLSHKPLGDVSVVINIRHCGDVIMGAIASQITSLTIVYSTVNWDADKKKNIKAPRHWPLCGEFTGDRWILRANGQLRGKCFHLMTSSWFSNTCLLSGSFLCYCPEANADTLAHWPLGHAIAILNW